MSDFSEIHAATLAINAILATLEDRTKRAVTGISINKLDVTTLGDEEAKAIASVDIELSPSIGAFHRPASTR